MKVDVHSYFSQLGNTIELQWRKSNYDEKVFPGIAQNCLVENKIHQQISYSDILYYFGLNNTLDPLQLDQKFGDIQITLYKSEYFFIEALFWMNGTTSIHQHAFCGAFTLLHGKSINTEYTFINKTRINAHFYLGELQHKNSILLTTGDIQKIDSGDRFIHSVFHLDSPSVTLVIRNHASIDQQPQLSYYPLYVATNGWKKDLILDKKISAMRLMLDHCKSHGYALLEKFINIATLYEVFYLFIKINLFTFENEWKNKFEMLIRNKEYGNLILKSLEKKYHSDRLSSLRSFIKDVDQRLFLAVLMNTPKRKNILNQLQQLFGCRNLQSLEKIVSQFISKITSVYGVGFKKCECIEKIVPILLKEYSPAQEEKSISELGDQAIAFYYDIQNSFVFKNWFIDYEKQCATI